MSGRNCVRHLLAQGAVAQVDYCDDCGVVRLSMESITVRFRPAALRDLRDMLSAALAWNGTDSENAPVNRPRAMRYDALPICDCR